MVTHRLPPNCPAARSPHDSSRFMHGFPALSGPRPPGEVTGVSERPCGVGRTAPPGSSGTRGQKCWGRTGPPRGQLLISGGTEHGEAGHRHDGVRSRGTAWGGWAQTFRGTAGGLARQGVLEGDGGVTLIREAELRGLRRSQACAADTAPPTEAPLKTVGSFQIIQGDLKLLLLRPVTQSAAGLRVPEGDHFQAGHFPADGDLGRKGR